MVRHLSLPPGLEPQGWDQIKRYVFVIPLVLCHLQLWSQNDSTKVRNSLEFGVGAAHYRMVDQGFTFRQLPFWGTSPQLRVGYNRNFEKSIFQVWLEASNGKIHTYDGVLPSQFVYTQLAFSYLKKVKNYYLLGSQAHFFAGIQLSTSGWFTENLNQLDNADFLFVHGLHIRLVQLFQFSPSYRLQASATFPIMAFVKREIYNGGINKTIEDEYKEPFQFIFRNSQFTFLLPTNLAQFQLKSIHQLSPRTEFNLCYRFCYVSNFSREPMRLYSNELLAGFQFTF